MFLLPAVSWKGGSNSLPLGLLLHNQFFFCFDAQKRGQTISIVITQQSIKRRLLLHSGTLFICFGISGYPGEGGLREVEEDNTLRGEKDALPVYLCLLYDVWMRGHKHEEGTV
jgi:hypothetical protein